MANATAERAERLTLRRDAWWVEPLITVVVLSAFGIYATWRAFANEYYFVEPYLSPFYSPLILADWWPISPAILILWAPLGFRVTCYYYRKAYYRSFFWSPPSCAVKPRPKEGAYTGETRFPYILQNIHRYFLYAATVVVLFLWYDAIKAFFFEDGFGVGVGTIVLLLNAFLLTMYSLSCHSFRHLVGGNLDVFSRCPTRHKLWGGASALNANHMFWAWISLVVVALADLYVMLVAMGVITDVRLI
jgi:hypothetical protein